MKLADVQQIHFNDSKGTFTGLTCHEIKFNGKVIWYRNRYINTTPSSLVFTNTGGTKTFDLSSNAAWSFLP